MIKVSAQQIGKVALPEEVQNWDLVKERLASVNRARAESAASALTDGLHDAADRAAEDLAINEETTESFLGVKEDAEHTKFVAHDELHSQVGDRVMTEVEVTVADELTPSGQDPEVVADAFELGSAAWNVPATSFSRRVMEQQAEAAKQDVEEVERALE